jgi:hypothetical protein
MQINRLAIEHRELAISRGKQRRSHSKKQNLKTGVYTKLGKYLFRGSNGTEEGCGQPGKDWLGVAEDEQTDFGRDTQADRGTDGAQATVHVEVSHGSRSRGEE